MWSNGSSAVIDGLDLPIDVKTLAGTLALANPLNTRASSHRGADDCAVKAAISKTGLTQT